MVKKYKHKPSVRNKPRDRKRVEPAGTQSKGSETEPDPPIEKGNIKASIDLLYSQIAKESNDEKRRLLGRYLIDLEEYQESISVLNGIDNKSATDLYILGFLFFHAQDWENSCKALEESLQLHEASLTYCLLAEAKIQNRKIHQIDPSEIESITLLLKAAITLPRCPLRGFHVLADIQQTKNYNSQEIIEILQKALENYPDSEETRHKLAFSLIYSHKDFRRALDTLSPLLAQNEPSLKTLSYAFSASHSLGNFETAFKYLCMIKTVDKTHGTGLDKLKGDILLKLGRIKDAISYYEYEIERDDIQAKFIGYFSRSWANLTINNILQAIDDASKGAEIWFENCETLDIEYSLRESQIYLDTEAFDYEGISECVKQACIILLKEAKDEELLSRELTGRLNYLLYLYYDVREIKNPSLLLQASELINHPKLSQSLSSYYLEAGDLSQAINHHLIFCLWKYGLGEEEYGYYYVTFDHEYDKNLTSNKTKRTKIHNVGMRYLKACKDANVIRHVFMAFYQSFWKPFLLEYKMFKEITEVTSIILNFVPDAQDESWDYAYNLHELKDLDRAEKAYRQYLTHWPTNFAALHNLALILEAKGAYQEALELSNKAVSFAPDNENVAKHNTYLTKNIDQLQEKFRRDQSWASANKIHRWGNFSEAEEAYKKHLEQWPDSHSALYNLSILSEKRGAYQEALEFIMKAIALEPENKTYFDQNKKLKVKLDQYNKTSKEKAELLNTAPERWSQIDYYKKCLLISLTSIESFKSWAHLAKLTKLEEKYLPGHWRKLVEFGMIVEDGENRYHVNELILPLLEKHQTGSSAPKYLNIPKKADTDSVVTLTLSRTSTGLPFSLPKSLKDIKLFYCYAHEDKELRDELEIHLSSLKRRYHLTNWHDREILPGADWEEEIDKQLNEAHLILLLISPNFLASNYCYTREMQKALERHQAGSCHVVPILLRPAYWEDEPFSTIQMLPTGAKAITRWDDRDEAFEDVARGIGRALKEVLNSLKTKEEWLDESNTFRKLKCFEEALTAIDQAIRMDPNYAISYTNKGHILQDLGNTIAAEQAFEKARQLGYTS